MPKVKNGKVDPPAVVSEPAETSTPEKPQVEVPAVLVREGKVAKVKYSLSYPNPAVATLSPEQTAEVVRRYFHLRAGALLAESVRKESPLIADFQREASAIRDAFMEGIPELTGEALEARVLALGKKRNPQFRLAPTSAFSASLADMLKEEEKEADETESESPAEPETKA